ncbi:MAG: hypothetical protein E6Q78_03050 [Rhodoferax sp.]|nr:MAG: hypothetical protein E6Q78_03050 [Rhodoferax sp.]
MQEEEIRGRRPWLPTEPSWLTPEREEKLKAKQKNPRKQKSHTLKLWIGGAIFWGCLILLSDLLRR